MIQLTAKSGPVKGGSWQIGTRPLVLGRATLCNITIPDQTVSRKHCEIVLAGNEIRLTDLGSSNTTLVNGKPVKEFSLRVGDEVAVGSAVFLVTSMTEGEGDKPQGPPALTPTKTLSMSADDSVFLRAGMDDATVQGNPRTVSDLAALFNLGRQASRAGSVAELFEIFANRLRERFDPTALWVARVRDTDDLLFYPREMGSDAGVNKAPLAVIHRALREQRGLLTPSTRRSEGNDVFVSTLAAPMCVGEERIGVVALESVSPKGVYDEADLEFLVAVAHTIAPFIHAVERVEQLRRDNERLRVRAGDSLMLIGVSKAISRVRALARKAAHSDLSVLILGETGTGKELIAHMVHDLSPRADGPLVIVNCAAIPHELFESELFGYEPGAFTGAIRSKTSRIEQAHGGTLFLDEVGDLSLDNQGRILRAVELGVFHRVGAETESKVDIRMVSATNKDLASGGFRSDLYHRLNGFEITVPPLRDRPSDIPILAEYFLQIGRDRAKHPIAGFDPEAMKLLCSHLWPGNVRELRSVINRAIIMTQHDLIQIGDLHCFEAHGAPDGADQPFSLAVMEKQHITAVLRECGGKISAAARLLEISRNTLYNKIAEYGIKV